MLRRTFLSGSAASLAAVAVVPSLAQPAPPFASQVAKVPDPWQMLGRLLQDQFVSPNQASYSQAALPNNLRFEHVRPRGIAYCTTPEMIADVIRWCRDYDVPFAVRGGGHSYAGFSTTSGLVIDMAEMGAIAVDPQTGVATLGAGAINGWIYSALEQAGLMITHGRCPTVGLAGFLMGGGIGFNMRRLGMGCDAVTSARIVTADGAILDLSEDENPDLFWAIRGGAGGNFGVATSFTLKTQVADERLTVFRLVWRSNIMDVAAKLFEVLDAAPKSLGTRVSLGGINPAMIQRGRQVPLTLLGQFAGAQDEFLALIAPILAEGAPEFSQIEEVPYWEGQMFLADEGEPAFYRERSAFHPVAPSREFLGAAIEEMARWPGTGAAANLVFFQTGGRVNEVPSDATAFVHRDSRWLSTANLVWTRADAGRSEVVQASKDWQDRLYKLVNDAGARGSFQNFPDSDLSDWRERYYGANLARLTSIKSAADPANLFRFAQSIG